MKRRARALIEEHEAPRELERIFFEIRQVLRLTGVDVVFRAWAAHERLLRRVWDEMRPNAQSRAFEEAADEVRRQAVQSANAFGPAQVFAGAELGESQQYRLRAALDLFHYAYPKQLVFVAAVRRGLEGQLPGPELMAGAATSAELVEHGPPPAMHAWEMEREDASDPRVQALFTEFRRAMTLPFVPSDYRALALYPEYLERAWPALHVVGQQPSYAVATDALAELARSVASSLPHAVDLSLSTSSRQRARDEHASFLEIAALFERLLARLTLDIARLELDVRPAESAQASPFPAFFRPVASMGGGA